MTGPQRCQHCEAEWAGLPSDHVCTLNRFLVAGSGAHIVFLRPLPQRLTHADALLIAAYLVCMADVSVEHADFARVLSAVERA